MAPAFGVRYGCGDFKDDQKTYTRLNDGLREGQIRKFLMGIVNDKQLEFWHLERSFPDFELYRRRCCYLIARLGINGPKTRKCLYKSLTSIWNAMNSDPLDRHDFHILTRNIFFLVTNTGRCCETCLSFDIDPDDSEHKYHCKKKENDPQGKFAKLGCTLDGRNLIVCNGCLHEKDPKEDFSEKAVKNHVEGEHSFALQIIMGYYCYKYKDRMKLLLKRPLKNFRKWHMVE